MNGIVLISPKEAAKRLGLSISTLLRMRERGDGPPFVRLGRSIPHGVHELDRWMAERTFASTADEAARRA